MFVYLGRRVIKIVRHFLYVKGRHERLLDAVCMGKGSMRDLGTLILEGEV